MNSKNDHLITLTKKLRQDLSFITILIKRLLKNRENILLKQKIALIEIIRLM